MGCYFLPLGLELYLLCHSRDTGCFTDVHDCVRGMLSFCIIIITSMHVED